MISISIINYKTPNLVKKLIESIQKFSENIDYEIIVVDNDSQDKSREILQFSEQNIQVIWSEKNLGFWAGHNLARKYATGEYFFILNSDTLFFENTLEILKKEFEKISKIENLGFLQPRLFLNNEKTKIQETNAERPWFFDIILENIPFLQKFFSKKFQNFRYTDWDRNSSRFVGSICGAAMFTKTEIFDEIGKFDERFFMYFEEYDICGRALDYGYKNYYTVNTSIIHFWNKSPASSWKKKKIYLTSFIKFIFKEYVFLGKNSKNE